MRCEIGRLQREISFRLSDLRVRLNVKAAFDLSELRFGLGELLIEIGRSNVHEQIALLNARPNIDLALGDIASRSGKDIGGLEGLGLARQKWFRSALSSRFAVADAHRGNEVRMRPLESVAACEFGRQ